MIKILKKIKRILLKVLGLYNFDREAERLLEKSIILYNKGGINKFRALRISNILKRDFNLYIPPNIKIGKKLYIAHPQGITVGRTAIIGDNVKLYPFSAIVAKLNGDEKLWDNGARRHAKIGNNCILGYGSKIIGPIEIGNNVVIAAGAIVTKNVPDNSLVKNVNQISKLPDTFDVKW